MSYRMLPIVMVAVCVVLAGGIARAENPDEAAIRALIQSWGKAAASQDWETLDSLCSEDWMFSSHMGTVMHMKDLHELFTHVSDHTIEFYDAQVRVSGDGSMAYATFKENTTYKYDGQPMDEAALFTAAFEKIDGSWKNTIVQRTVFVDPQAPASAEQ